MFGVVLSQPLGLLSGHEVDDSLTGYCVLRLWGTKASSTTTLPGVVSRLVTLSPEGLVFGTLSWCHNVQCRVKPTSRALKWA